MGVNKATQRILAVQFVVTLMAVLIAAVLGDARAVRSAGAGGVSGSGGASNGSGKKGDRLPVGVVGGGPWGVALAQAARRVLMQPLDEGGRLWLAGEAAHETLWGTVGGAWLSGERAAAAVLQALSRPGR